MRAPTRPLAAIALGLLAGLLTACGGAGKGLIPASAAGPLQSDFEAVAHAAEAGNGSCAGTEAALARTEQDLGALPSTVDAGLRSRLEQGVSNLRKRALAMCTQPTATVTTATTPTTTTTTPTTTTPTQTTPTTPTPTTPTSTTPASPSEGGGTAAPGEGQAEEGKGKGKGKDKGEGEGEGEGSSGGVSPGAGQ